MAHAASLTLALSRRERGLPIAARDATRPEIRWVLSCLRSLSGWEARPAPAASLNWRVLLDFVETHGLAPALAVALKSEAPEVVPAAARERLTRRLAESMACQLLLSRELGKILRQVKAEGLAVIPLKGPVLAEAFYPDQALRPFNDLDLLIRSEALLQVDELLRRLGYRRVADAHSWSFDIAYDRSTLYEGPTGLRVDLHWGLVNDSRYSWNHCEGLTVWDRAIPIRVASEEALGLCPEDLLLYLAVHLAVHHALAGLLWYWDLALLLDHWADRLDWEAVIVRASHWRVRNALFFVFLGLGIFFGVSAPPSVMAQLKPWGLRATALGRLVRHHELERLACLEHLIPLLLVDRGTDLLASFRQLCWPPAAWVRARYEGVASSLPAQYLAHYRRMGALMRQAILTDLKDRWTPQRSSSIT